MLVRRTKLGGMNGPIDWFYQTNFCWNSSDKSTWPYSDKVVDEYGFSSRRISCGVESHRVAAGPGVGDAVTGGPDVLKAVGGDSHVDSLLG